ncbi:hypothetical protein [Novosphingobium sp. HII-3]|uniref:hypothetical protein n=1 Tax=Novosphingobium sp. HII-3 TaxID=2075565 RepID=UPI0011AF96D8|nr:hypothetical protein [Novosphingobium sp. HII-3]
MIAVHQRAMPGGWSLSMFTATIAVGASLVAEKGGLPLKRSPVFVLGDASYARYLLHPFVTQAAILNSIELDLTDLCSAAAVGIDVIGGFIAAAWLVYSWVEKPLGTMEHDTLWLSEGVCSSAEPVSLKEERG